MPTKTKQPAPLSLTLTAQQLSKLSELAGRSITTFQDLSTFLTLTNTIHLNEGIEIELDGDDLDTLRNQAVGMGASNVEDYIKDFIHEAVAFQLHGSFVRY